MENVVSNTAIHRNGNLFFWEAFVGHADASTLDIPVGSLLPRLIAVTSHRTGRTVPFRFKTVEHLDTGNGAAVAVYDSRDGFSILVYND
jgi:hypothetical protein